MKRLLSTALITSLLLLTATAFAQRYSPSTWRALYVGEVGNEAVSLDLTLGPGDFAFARMALSSSKLVLDGVGTYAAGSDEFWLEFREPEFRAPASTAADIAYYDQAYAEEAGQPHPGRLPLLVTLTGTREVTWEDDGRTLEVTATFIQGLGKGETPVLEPLTTTLERVAQYAFVITQQGRIDVGYSYPRFSGDTAALNTLLEAAADRRYAEWIAEGRHIVESGEGLGWAWTHHEDVDVTGWAGPYRSLLRNFSYYTGGAHPLHHSESALYRLAGERVNELYLPDLFAPESNWLQALNELLLEDLRRQDAAWVVDGSIESLEAEDLRTFTLGPAGLSFVFDTYEVGPYVQGDFVSTIGYDVLLPLAAPNGVIEAFADTYTGR